MAEKDIDEQKSPNERAKERIKQEQAKIRIRDAEGEYKFDNPELEYKTKRATKMSLIEDKYKDKPKIAFHVLSEEGNKLHMQAKRDRVWTTLGYSLIGNIVGIGLVQYLMYKPPRRWAAPRFGKQREMLFFGTFVTTVGFWTLYGFGLSRQTYVKAKIDIVEKYSIKTSSQ